MSDAVASSAGGLEVCKPFEQAFFAARTPTDKSLIDSPEDLQYTGEAISTNVSRNDTTS